MGHLLKHPDLPISCRPWHPMPIVMEEGHLLPGRPPEHSGQPPNLLHSAVGFRLCLYLALGSHLSFWSCRFPPIVSSALCISCSNITCTYSSPVTCPTWGWEGPPSTPVWHRAGSWLCLGGSTPTFRAITMVTDTVFILSLVLHVCSKHVPIHSLSSSLLTCMIMSTAGSACQCLEHLKSKQI